MSVEQDPPRRTVRTLSAGSTVSVGLGALLWVVAAYFFYAPVQAPTSFGTVVSCGSASTPSEADAAAAVCGDWTTERRWLALTFLAAGVVVAVAGIAAFGTSVRDDRADTDAWADAAAQDREGEGDDGAVSAGAGAGDSSSADSPAIERI